MNKFIVIVTNLNDEVLKEETYCNNLSSKENLINSITFNSYDTVLTNKEVKEKIEGKIKELKYGFLYEDSKYKYWTRK